MITLKPKPNFVWDDEVNAPNQITTTPQEVDAKNFVWDDLAGDTKVTQRPPLISEKPDPATVARMERVQEGASSMPDVMGMVTKQHPHARVALEYGPKIISHVAKTLPGKVGELVKMIPKIGPALAQAVSEMDVSVQKPMDLLELPSTVAKEAYGKVVKPFVGGAIQGEVESWKEMAKDPLKFAYEKPDELIFKAFDVLAGTLLVKGVARMGKMASVANKAKKFTDVVDTVEDVTPDEVMGVSAKMATPPTPPQPKPGLAVDMREEIGKLAPSPRSESAEIYDTFHSPHVPLGRDPYGQKLYDAVDTADLNKRKWFGREDPKFRAATKGIKRKGALDAAIGEMRDAQASVADVLKMDDAMALERGISPESLAAVKKSPVVADRANKFFNDRYEATLRLWGTSAVGKAEEANIWGLIKSENPSKKILDALTDDEKLVYNIYSRKIEDYFPHIFDKQEVYEMMSKDLDLVNTGLTKAEPGGAGYLRLMKRRDELAASLNSLRSGGATFYDAIPKDIKFRFFNVRRGATGYQQSALQAYETYMHGIAKKIFDEPMLREATGWFEKMDPNLKSYARWYLQDYMGWTKPIASKMSGNIKSLVWTAKLGLNPRSAIVNLTQRINTIAEAPLDSITGARMASTKFGERLFKRSGIAETIPTVLMEGDIASRPLEAIREAMGFMFSRVERGNQKHAFLTGYARARRMGKTHTEGMLEGRRLFEKTQFRYGKVDMPKVLRGPGGVVLQFWSYPIKQMEFLSDLARNDPKKLLGWIAMSEGGKMTIGELLDIDMSSSMGLGIKPGEFIEALASIPKEEYRKTLFHLQKAVSGGGFIPQGVGPFVDSFVKIIDSLGDTAPAFSDMLDQVVLSQGKRTIEGVKALREGPEEGLYTVRNIYTDNPKYRESLKDIMVRTLIARPMEEKRQGDEMQDIRKTEEMGRELTVRMATLIVTGREDKAFALSERYNVPMPTKTSVDNAMIRMHMTPLEIAEMRKSERYLGLEEKLK